MSHFDLESLLGLSPMKPIEEVVYLTSDGDIVKDVPTATATIETTSFEPSGTALRPFFNVFEENDIFRLKNASAIRSTMKRLGFTQDRIDVMVGLVQSFIRAAHRTVQVNYLKLPQELVNEEIDLYETAQLFVQHLQSATGPIATGVNVDKKVSDWIVRSSDGATLLSDARKIVCSKDLMQPGVFKTTWHDLGDVLVPVKAATTFDFMKSASRISALPNNETLRKWEEQAKQKNDEPLFPMALAGFAKLILNLLIKKTLGEIIANIHPRLIPTNRSRYVNTPRGFSLPKHIADAISQNWTPEFMPVYSGSYLLVPQDKWLERVCGALFVRYMRDTLKISDPAKLMAITDAWGSGNPQLLVIAMSENATCNDIALPPAERPATEPSINGTPVSTFIKKQAEEIFGIIGIDPKKAQKEFDDSVAEVTKSAEEYFGGVK